MVKSSPLLGVSLSLTSLLLSAAQLAVTPSPGAVEGALDASQRLWGDISRLSGKDKETRAFAQRVAESLDDRLRTVSSDADEQEIRGAATAVGALLREVSTDNATVVEAVRHPEDLGSLLRRRAAPHRALVAASAEPFFDMLLPAVAEELARLAPGSPRFQVGALTQLLDGLDDIQEGLGDLQHGQTEIKEGIAGIHDRLDDIASPRPAAAPGRIRFGSRPGRAPHFVPRSEQETAHRYVVEEAEPLTALTGMRGRGKSQVATTVATHCEEAGWPLVAWITASSREALVSALAELGRRLGVSTEEARSPEVLAERCLDQLRSTEATDRLIVLDNVENFDDLRDMVPSGPGLRVLATTTRTQLPGHWTTIPVDVFSREQSVARILDDNDGDEEIAAAIAEALGDLPVAVAQAAATIRSNRYTVEEYLRELQKYPISDVVTRVEGEDYPDAVGAALRQAYQSALHTIAEEDDERGEVAAAQLGTLSLLAASGVPVRWLTGMDDDSPVPRRALHALRTLSVCEFSEDGAYVSLHRLQSQVIREDWRPGSEAGARAAEAAVTVLAAVDISSRESFEEQRREALDLAEQLRTVAAWEDHSRRDPWGLFSDPRTAQALAHAIWESSELGAPQEALSLAEAVDLSATALGEDNLQTLACRHNLAGAYRDVGRLKESIDLYEQVLTDRERVLGPNHPRTLTTRHNLAGAYQAAGRFDEAIDLYEQTLTDTQRVLGADHPGTLTTRHNLAGAYRAAGRFDEAIDLYEQVLTDRERVLGPNHPDTLTTRHNLAGAYQSAGRLNEAIDLYEQVLTDRERVLGPNHPRTLTTRHNLAYTYQAAGRLNQAIDLYEQVLTDHERGLGPNHPHTLTTRNNLAYTYQAAGRLNQAIDLYEQTLTDRERVLGPNHPGTLTTRANLAGAYQDAGRLDQAIDLYEQTLTDTQHVLGADHPDTLTTRNNLAYTYQAAGRLNQAIDLFEQTLTDTQRVLGPNHPGTLTTRHNLAGAYQDAGRLNEAIDLYEQVLTDHERVLGPNHPGTLTTRANLAGAYRAAGREEDAAALEREGPSSVQEPEDTNNTENTGDTGTAEGPDSPEPAGT